MHFLGPLCLFLGAPSPPFFLFSCTVTCQQKVENENEVEAPDPSPPSQT